MNTYIINTPDYETEVKADHVEYDQLTGTYDFCKVEGIVGFDPLTTTIIKDGKKDLFSLSLPLIPPFFEKY